MICKYYISTSEDPYINLATERALYERINDDYSLLYLWQNQHTIVIGKNQDAFIECKVKEFEESGGRVARRLSGGGTVYHDMGNLNFSILSTIKDSAMLDYRKIIIEILKKQGINAEFNGKNDLLVNNRKFSGNSAYKDSTKICQHGTILINSNISNMDYYLTPNTEKLSKNNVNSVYSRVINLGSIYPSITVDWLKQELIDITQAELIEEPITDVEYGKYRYFSNNEWIFGGKK